MKKIMFDNNYGLESAVLYGRKTMTRRMIPPKFGEALNRIAKKCVWAIPIDSIPEGVSIEDVADAFAKADGELFFQVKSKSEEIKVQIEDSDIQPLIQCAPYKVGEVVAIAQSYETIMNNMLHGTEERFVSKVLKAHNKKKVGNVKGWFNKMYVCAELMPHQIQITDVKIERLQAITDEDCLKEGVEKWIDCYIVPGIMENQGKNNVCFDTPCEAFHELICKLSGKNIWIDNPYVFAYSFKLIK